MQAFLQGGEPVIGARAPEELLEICRFLIAEAGTTDDEAQAFLGRGMLINVLLGLRIPAAAGSDAEAAALLHAACGPSFDSVLAHGA